MKRLLCIFIFLFYLLHCTLVLAGQNLTVDISGVPDPARKNIESRLQVLQESYGDLSLEDIQDFYKSAPADIKKALEPFGFFRAEIIEQKLIQKNNQWIAHFTVSTGPALFIQHVSVSLTGPGRNNPQLQKLVADFPLKAGQVLESAPYETAKNTLLLAADDEGYLQAELLKKEIRIDLKTYRADIILQLDTGERFYFGPVTFTETPFSADFLKRFLTFQPGEPFSSKTLLQTQQDLSKSHYFDQVIITPDPSRAVNHAVPVQVFLTVPKAKQYNVGFGYGTFTGPRITLGTDYRRIGDSGQHFTAQIKLSSVLSGLAAKYIIPGKNPLTDQYTLGADAQKFTPQNGESFSETFSGSYIKTIQDWQQSISLNYLIERFQVESDPSEVSRMLYPSYTLSRTKVDNLIFPRSGSTFHFTLNGASENVLASTSFIQSDVKGKYIFSPSNASRVIVRADLGYTVVNDLSRLPLTLRYFAGGPGSVRGYNISSLGPGRYLKTASVEYQHQLYGNFSGSLFYDAGNASDHFNQPLLGGEGVGIIYNSLLGPVQVYVARAMSKQGKPLSVDFSIGPDL